MRNVVVAPPAKSRYEYQVCTGTVPVRVSFIIHHHRRHPASTNLSAARKRFKMKNPKVEIARAFLAQAMPNLATVPHSDWPTDRLNGPKM